MKFITRGLIRFVAACALLFTALSGYGEEQQNPQLQQDVQAVKQAVLELNKDLYELEQNLLSPATTRAAFYVSLAYGEFFEPLSIEISAQDVTPIQHIYTERQVSALRRGAVQPLAQFNLGPGKHLFHVLVRGVDHLGQARELMIHQEVEKTAQPLLMEILISDQQAQANATAQLRTW
ncbi:hypothetical protein [Bacterioplanoides sp.]|uniref:hypothetical protein n=1 Tax=Bacterioplanoides sp. TaxID=2066072 RepID=UPI003B0081C0